jgi:hypothetical protein
MVAALAYGMVKGDRYREKRTRMKSGYFMTSLRKTVASSGC